MDFTNFPPPPPWIFNTKSGNYENQVKATKNNHGKICLTILIIIGIRRVFN